MSKRHTDKSILEIHLPKVDIGNKFHLIKTSIPKYELLLKCIGGYIMLIIL